MNYLVVILTLSTRRRGEREIKKYIYIKKEKIVWVIYVPLPKPPREHGSSTSALTSGIATSSPTLC